MREIFHPDFRAIDIPKIESSLRNEEFIEFMQCLEKEFRLIRRNPLSNGSSPCEFPPLLDYRKKKFFSVIHEPEGGSPNMRLLYRYDQELNTVYYLAVGERINTKPIDPKDIYQSIKMRDFTF